MRTSLLVYPGLLSLALFLGAMATGHGDCSGPPLVIALGFFAGYFQGHKKLNVLSFTFWVFTMTTWALYYPAHFTSWSGFSLGTLITPLIQLIMLGMGATLSLADFARALSMPRTVLIGMVLQFSVMP